MNAIRKLVALNLALILLLAIIPLTAFANVIGITFPLVAGYNFEGSYPFTAGVSGDYVFRIGSNVEGPFGSFQYNPGAPWPLTTQLVRVRDASNNFMQPASTNLEYVTIESGVDLWLSGGTYVAAVEYTFRLTAGASYTLVVDRDYDGHGVSTGTNLTLRNVSSQSTTYTITTSV